MHFKFNMTIYLHKALLKSSVLPLRKLIIAQKKCILLFALTTSNQLPSGGL